MEQEHALTAWGAISALLPLIGTGGFTAIMVAFLAYRKAALEGRRGDPEHAGLGISALLADSGSIKNLAISIDRAALALDKIALLTAESREEFFDRFGHFLDRFEKYIDEVRELRRAVEDKR